MIARLTSAAHEASTDSVGTVRLDVLDTPRDRVVLSGGRLRGEGGVARNPTTAHSRDINRPSRARSDTATGGGDPTNDCQQIADLKGARHQSEEAGLRTPGETTLLHAPEVSIDPGRGRPL